MRLKLIVGLVSLAGCSFDASGVGNGPPVLPPGDSEATEQGSTAMTSEPPPPTTGDPDDTTTMGVASMTAVTTETSEPVDPTTSPSSDSDDDTSTTNPPPASCGNGAVEEGEECDDGDADNSDDCLDTCVLAECGDGFVHAGDEECDDGNEVEADGCTSACVFPTCMDGAMNGGETDVDCGGGMCGGCQAQEMCSSDGDCVTGACDGVCVYARSCAELKSKGMPTGKYAIDPDGSGVGASFEVWCEQDHAGGGWTMVLKVDGRTSNFHYDDTKWGQTGAWMANADLSRTETKLQSYSTVAVEEVLLGMEAPIMGGDNPLMLSYLQISLQAPVASLHAIFSPGTYVSTNKTIPAWLALVPGSVLQPNCRTEGFNVKTAMDTNMRVRLGATANEQDNCQSPNSFIGVGASLVGDGCDGGFEATSGNGAVCGVPKTDIPGFAVVFVR